VNLAVARQSRTPVPASIAFGLLLGAATFLLHGHNVVLDAATNSTSTWIIWTAIAGALIEDRARAMLCGALMMIATCAAYYVTAAANGDFGIPGIPSALVWTAAGIVGGPVLAWSAWSTRRAANIQRNLGVALIGTAVTGEGLWLGCVLHYWPTAAVFLTIGILLTIALTTYRHKAAGRHPWQPLIYLPVLAVTYLAAEYLILDRLLSAV
jgi:hypothetical protein